MKRLILLVMGVVVGPVWGGVDFESEVLPILQAKCFKCHGNGKLYEYPLEKLAPESRKKVEEWVGE